MSDELVKNRVRIVEINGDACMWPWVNYDGVTIEQAAIKYASYVMDRNAWSAVVEVERDGVSHLLGIEPVLTYRVTGLRGGG